MSWKATAFVKEITRDITAHEKLVMLILADYHHTVHKSSWPSLKELASESLVTERALCRILQRLEKKNLIVRHAGGGSGNRTEYLIIGLDVNTDPKSLFQEKETLTQTLTVEAKNTDPNTDPPAHAIRNEPVKEPVEPVRTGRATRLPEKFLPIEAHKKLAQELGVDMDFEFDKFRDYFLSISGEKALKIDWSKTFSNWLRNSINYSRGRGQYGRITRSEQRQQEMLSEREKARAAIMAR